MKKSVIFLFFTSMFFLIPSMVKAEETVGDLEKSKQDLEAVSLETEHSKEPSKKESKTDNERKSLLKINLFGAEINLLGGKSREERKPTEEPTSKKTSDSKRGSLNVDLSLPILGDVSVDLISSKKQESEADKTASSQKELAGVQIKDSKLLGNINVDVLPSKKEVEGDGKKTSGGLTTIDVNNQVGNVHVGVIEGSKQSSKDGKVSDGGLLVTDIEESIVGGAHLGVAEVYVSQSPGSKEIQAGLVNGQISNSFIGNKEISVIEFKKKQTEEDNTIIGGIIIIDVEDSLLGDVRIGVGEFEKIHKFPVINPTNPNDENMWDNLYPGVETPFPGYGDQPNDNPEGVSKPGDLTNSSIPKNENPDQPKHIEYAENEMISKKHLKKKDFVSEFIKELGEAGNLIAAPPSGQLVPINGSTSSSSSSPNINGGFGLIAFMDQGYDEEWKISNEVQLILKRVLSDQWIKAPPIKPPKESFFFTA